MNAQNRPERTYEIELGPELANEIVNAQESSQEWLAEGIG